MSTMHVAPYGSWLSPITSDLITSTSIRFSTLLVDGDDLYWIEQRPLEGGRHVIVCQPAGGAAYDITPPSYNARTLAHEYGGGAFTVYEGTVYFCNYDDQRIYRQERHGKPEPLTAPAKVHYADLIVDAKRNRLICVQEDHCSPEQEPITTLYAVSLPDGAADMLVAGNDFYANPRLSPDGRFLSWISWNHPNMPWDESMVWVANVASDGSLSNMRLIAGGNGESVFQPQWSPGGELHYVSDRSGWWNIYRHNDHGENYEEDRPLAPRPAEFGMPQWVFGMSTYSFQSAERIIATYCENGLWKLGIIDTTSGALQTLALPYTDYAYVQASADKAFFCAGSSYDSAGIVALNLANYSSQPLRCSQDMQINAGYISEPHNIEFPTAGGKNAHAFFYPPQNKDYVGTEHELPPLIVKSHGGPTHAAGSTLNCSIQYWTSRGFAVVDVNYGGSSGFGRDYRSRLYNSWGIVDVEDCINAAKYLVAKELVDKRRMAISGGSAGGYTTLCALVFHNVFQAGASYYGISDLEALACDTHKFESHYHDRLIGPYPLARELYQERSPINFVQRLNCPIIFMQGLEDKVVPPNQSARMVDVMRLKGIPVAYLAFAGEQHGFRQAKNIKRALEAELYFYSQIFAFDLPEPIEPVAIENLHQDKQRKVTN